MPFFILVEKGQIQLPAVVMGQVRDHGKTVQKGKVSVKGDGYSAGVSSGHVIGQVLNGLFHCGRDVLPIQRAIQNRTHSQIIVRKTWQRYPAELGRYPEACHAQKGINGSKCYEAPPRKESDQPGNSSDLGENCE